MTKKRLTKEQREEIINSKLKNVELSKIYGISHKTISGIRVNANMGIGQSAGGNYRIDAEKMAMILNPELRIVDVFHATGVSRKHILNVRKKNGIEKVKKPKIFKEKRPKINTDKPKRISIRDDITKMNKILDTSLSADEASEKTGVSKNRIWEIRKELGVKYKKPKVIIEPKPVKSKKVEVKINASMSHHEQNYMLRKKASEAVEIQKKTDSEKIKSRTHHWISRKNQYGKIEHVLIKLK